MQQPASIDADGGTVFADRRPVGHGIDPVRHARDDHQPGPDACGQDAVYSRLAVRAATTGSHHGQFDPGQYFAVSFEINEIRRIVNFIQQRRIILVFPENNMDVIRAGPGRFVFRGWPSSSRART